MKAKLDRTQRRLGRDRAYSLRSPGSPAVRADDGGHGDRPADAAGAVGRLDLRPTVKTLNPAAGAGARPGRTSRRAPLLIGLVAAPWRSKSVLDIDEQPSGLVLSLPALRPTSTATTRTSCPTSRQYRHTFTVLNEWISTARFSTGRSSGRSGNANWPLATAKDDLHRPSATLYGVAYRDAYSSAYDLSPGD